MSYILEALRKAEQQRELGSVPGIASDHEYSVSRTPGRWIWLLVLLLGASVIVLLFLVWPQRGQYELRPTSQPRIAEQRVPEPQLASRPTPPPPPSYLARESLDRPAAVAQRQVPQTPVRPQHFGNVATERVVPIDEKPLQSLELPVWPQIPQHIFTQLIGGLRLDVHVYSDHAEGRFVLINLQKYHEGDKLQNGPVLDAITPEGAILSFQGQKFRLQAQ